MSEIAADEPVPYIKPGAVLSAADEQQNSAATSRPHKPILPRVTE